MSQHKRRDLDGVLPTRWHERIREMLPEYAMFRASSRPPGSEWRELEGHLATCDECRAEVEELRTILIDTYTGRVQPASAYPPPDFSFLPARQPALPLIADRPAPAAPSADEPEGSGVLDHVRHVIIRFSEAQLNVRCITGLAGGFRHEHDPADAYGSHFSSYQHPRHSEGDLYVTIDVSVTDEARNLCRVLVSAVDPRDPFDQEGRAVTLRFGTFTREATSDHQGYAAFADIPLDSLSQIECTIGPRRGSVKE